MAVSVGGRTAVLLGKDANYPAAIAYYLAHELGHANLGHLKDGTAVVDLGDPLEEGLTDDAEELQADRFALELLTGKPEPVISTETRRFTAEQLASNLLRTSKAVRIEPGTMALCFGHSTGDWKKVNAALKFIYSQPQPVWSEVNRVALSQLDWAALSDDLGFFLHAVMGGLHGDRGRN